jgi:hypothetical protein
LQQQVNRLSQRDPLALYQNGFPIGRVLQIKTDDDKITVHLAGISTNQEIDFSKTLELQQAELSCEHADPGGSMSIWRDHHNQLRRNDLQNIGQATMTLAATNCRSENIGIAPVVVPELKLRDVQRHIFGADFVEATDDPAFEDAPEAFNRVRMNRANNVLLFVVVNGLVIVASQTMINFAFVRGEQANSIAHHFADECLCGFASDVRENAGDHVAFAAYRTNDRSFGGRAQLTATVHAIPMFVLVLAADKSLIDFNDAAELLDIFDKGRADFVAHQPSGFVTPEAHEAHDLQSAHALFAGEHQVSDAKPVAQGLIGVLEYRSSDMGEPVSVRGALFALPMPLARLKIVHLGVAAARAMDAIRPSAGHQIGLASIFVRECRFKLCGGHLRDWFRTFCHGPTLSIDPYSQNNPLLSSPGYSPL